MTYPAGSIMITKVLFGYKVWIYPEDDFPRFFFTLWGAEDYIKKVRSHL